MQYARAWFRSVLSLMSMIYISMYSLCVRGSIADKVGNCAYVRHISRWIDSFFDHAMRSIPRRRRDSRIETSILLVWQGSSRYARNSVDHENLQSLVLKATEFFITYEDDEGNFPRWLTTFFHAGGDQIRIDTRYGRPPDLLFDMFDRYDDELDCDRYSSF